MSEFTDDINQSVATLNSYKTIVLEPSKRRKRSNDSTYIFSGSIPLERRRSDRLLNVTPQYSYADLIDDEVLLAIKIYLMSFSIIMLQDIKSYHKYTNDIDDLEEVKFKQRKTYTKKSSSVVPYVPVEEITSIYLENIATRVTVKTYCTKNGTSCHQCRQKTLDSKTYCRSGHCVGVRGQFCGVCLNNRYGEDAHQVLLNPSWKCPPCRGLCNCSICRTREGKRPTGILAPLAFQYGHKSVKDFLLSLNGKYDYTDKTEQENNLHKNANKHTRKRNDTNQFLIGFNQDLKPVWTVENKWLAFGANEGDLLGFSENKEPVMIKI